MTNDKLVEMRIAHLNMVQGVISRMSGFSASAKNFCVSILAAFIAVAFQKSVPLLFIAPVGVILIFASMDTYYLALERQFRDLFERVASRPIADADQLSLKNAPVTLTAVAHATTSLSILPFYLLLLAMIVPLLYAAEHVRPEPKDTVFGASCVAGAGKPIAAGEPASVVAVNGGPPRKVVAYNGPFNRGLVKEVSEHPFSIYDWVIADGIVSEVVSGFSFSRAGNAVCRVQGRLRGRDIPAAG